MRPRKGARCWSPRAPWCVIGVACALAAATARAQSAPDVDWSLPDPFEHIRPTSTTTPERVAAPAEEVALSRPLVLRSVVVYGPSRPAAAVASPSLRPLVPMDPPARAEPSAARPEPSRPRVEPSRTRTEPSRVRTEPREPSSAERRRPRLASIDPSVARVPSVPSMPPSDRPERREPSVAPTVVAPSLVAPPARRSIPELPGDPPHVGELRSLSADACFARLRDTGTPFERLAEGSYEGVEQPAILRGPLGGVTFRAYGTASGTRLHQVVDCRLALAMMRAAPVFRAAGVREVRYLSIYRPGSRVRSGSRAGHVSLHAHALAIDVPSFVRDDGTVLSVLRDWGPAPRGAPVCGPDAVLGTTDASAALRAIACDLFARRAFQMILTPQYDQAHRDHFHLQLDPDESRVSVR